MAKFGAEGRGVLIYLREGSAGVPAEALTASEKANPDPDALFGDGVSDSEEARVRYWREIGVGAQILRDLGVSSIKLLALRHLHYVGLEGFGIELAHTELLPTD
ncbi:MAG: 3,4-dihydroxy 2-butanone 4-phosphate synthase/GTP cyclohydrolase II [Gammaproteobacteria bacterium]